MPIRQPRFAEIQKKSYRKFGYFRSHPWMVSMSEVSAQTIAHTIAKHQLASQDIVRAAFARHPDSTGKAINHIVKSGALTPWQATRLLTGESHGYRFGPYVMQDRAGSTPIARIFKALDTRSGTLKRIIAFRRRHTADNRQVEALRIAVEPLVGWEHPHTVNYLQLGYEPHEGQHYLVTDVPPSASLKSHLMENGPLEPTAVLTILEQLAGALVGAVGRKAAHRDLGLDTILMENPESVRIDLWGWPACFPFTTTSDSTDRRRLYMALSESSRLSESDIRNDIFFLGCAMHEALTGKDPLGGSGAPPLDKLDSMVPLGNDELPNQPRMVRLIQSMESRAVENRCPSPMALLDEVRQARRAMAAPATGSAVGTTVFVLEDQLELQDVIRERFREYGYRVFIAADPARAMERYSSTPFDAAIVDVGHLGVGVLDLVDELRDASKRSGQRLRLVLLLDAKQAHLERDYRDEADVKALVRPFSVGRIHRTLQAMG